MAVEVLVSGRTPNLQGKTFYPLQNTTQLVPDAGYDGFSKVTIYGVDEFIKRYAFVEAQTSNMIQFTDSSFSYERLPKVIGLRLSLPDLEVISGKYRDLIGVVNPSFGGENVVAALDSRSLNPDGYVPTGTDLTYERDGDTITIKSAAGKFIAGKTYSVDLFGTNGNV